MGEGDSPRGSPQWAPSDNDSDGREYEEPDKNSEVSVRRTPSCDRVGQFLATRVDRTLPLVCHRRATHRL